MQLPAPFGKYELLERIAVGGMAEVFLARSFGVSGFEKRLVIKRLRAELAEDPRFVTMFINEAKIGVHLNHPNVVQVYELGRVGSAHYIAMEHLHGRDLTRLVRALRDRGERVPLAIAVAIVAQLCRGLAYAHGLAGSEGPLGLVHRDVSPHNVLVTFAGEVKLVDFGIARLIATAAIATDRKPGPGGGKYAYMSPEQAIGDPVDHRSDIFSTGIVLWELIVGHRLYQAPDDAEKLRRVREAVIPHPNEQGAAIDERLWHILSRSLARQRDDRYASASLLEEDLRAWLFENRLRVGRGEIAEVLKACFPDAPERPAGDEVQLAQMVADVDRIDRGDRTASDSGVTSSLPGRLRVPVGERRPVVVLMVDVDGLTELSATVEPEALLKRKYQMLRWARRVVDAHGGVLQQAVDDHITILFGVPRTRADDVMHALECALELQQTVGQLRRKGMAAELAIGVHAGEVTVSQVGKRVRYVARGDTTRLARRLSAVADQGEVLISERVLAQVEGMYQLRRGPPASSRGGKAGVPSWRIVGRSRTLKGHQAGTWLRRDDELEVLRASLLEIGSGRGKALALVGALGCGKSRLLREIRALAARHDTPFLGVRCTNLGTERPHEPLRDLIAAVLGLDPEAPTAELVAASVRLQHLGLSERDRSVVAALLGAHPDPVPEAGEIWQAVGRVLRGLARDAPVIAALDDLDALPSSSHADLAHLVRALADAPVLFLFGTRGPLPDEVKPLCGTVVLGPFGTELVTRLAATLLGADEVDPALVELLERTCEGNPLYLEEMLKYLTQHGSVAVTAGHAALTGTSGDRALPHSLQALLTARIDALDPASRGLLQLAAVVGPTFGESLLAEAAGLDDPQPLMLDLLANGLVVRERGSIDQWSFASDLVREAAIRGILGVQRSDYHRLVAAAIEKIYAGRLEPVLEELLVHCAEGGRALDAARYAHAAGQQLETTQLLDRARRCYRIGLEQLVRADRTPDGWDARVQGEATLNLRLGVVDLLLGETSDGHRRLRVALDIASEAGLPWIEARAHVALGRSSLQEGRVELADAHLTQARALLRGEPDPEVEREALEASALLAHEQGNHDEAERLWQQAMHISQDDSAAMARCEIGLANRYLRSGDHGKARVLLDKALARSRASGDRILEGRVLNNLGLVHAWAGRNHEALTFYRAALELREGIGYTRGVVINHHNIGDVHFHAGDSAKAWVAFQRSRDLAEEIGWARGVAFNDVYLGYLQANDNPELGLDALRAATERARGLGDAESVATGLWLVGRWTSDHGDPVEARRRLGEALDAARTYQLQPMVTLLEGLLDAPALAAPTDHAPPISPTG